MMSVILSFCVSCKWVFFCFYSDLSRIFIIIISPGSSGIPVTTPPGAGNVSIGIKSQMNLRIKIIIHLWKKKVINGFMLNICIFVLLPESSWEHGEDQPLYETLSKYVMADILCSSNISLLWYFMYYGWKCLVL